MSGAVGGPLVPRFAVDVIGDFVANIDVPVHRGTGHRLNRGSMTFADALARFQIRYSMGGAYFTALLLSSTFGKDAPAAENRIVLDVGASWEEHKVFPTITMWSPYQKAPLDVGSDKLATHVWRVLDYLGFDIEEPSRSTGTDLSRPRLLFPMVDRQDRSEPSSPDAVVIDDLGLDLRNRREDHVKLVEGLTDVRKVILKTRSPLSGNHLLESLVHSSHAERLSVVVPFTALRDRNPRLSRCTSWDQLVEHLVRDFTKDGPSTIDLGRAQRVYILLSQHGVAIIDRPMDGEHGAQLVFDRFEVEDSWTYHRPGTTLGALSILTAAATISELASTISPDDSAAHIYPAVLACRNALEAMRESHERGAKDVAEADFLPKGNIFTDHRPAQAAAGYLRRFSLPDTSSNLVERRLDLSRIEPGKWSLLSRAIGPLREQSIGIAIDIVHRGIELALPAVPRVRFGSYVTADRTEIELMSELQRRLLFYSRSRDDTRPLSLAVFGRPGAGKSWAIKELVRSQLRNEVSILNWNLSQIDHHDELGSAFDEIRDVSLGDKIPLVIWDEFDTDDLSWIQYFLEPMEDSKFSIRGRTRRFGRAIFVFSGGTCTTFEEFDLSDPTHRDHPLIDDPERDSKAERFRLKKGVDFVSRLRGYTNIKGVNRHPADIQEQDDGGFDYLVRRALVLRSAVLEHHPMLENKNDNVLKVDPRLIRCFLGAGQYLHESRSIRSIISLCAPPGQTWLKMPHLPSGDILKMHVTNGFTYDQIDAYCRHEDAVDREAASVRSRIRAQQSSGGSDDISAAFEDYPWHDDNVEVLAIKSNIRMSLARESADGGR